MKFLCQNCNAKYQIADEKIAGRTLRMKCRRCENEIVLHGDAVGPGTPAEPSPASNPPQNRALGSKPAAPHASQKKPATRQGSGVGPAPQRPGVPAQPPRKPSALGADFKRQIGQAPSEALGGVSASYDQWHVAINEVPVGPIRREELVAKISSGAVTGESLCWREGFDDWRPIRDIPELVSLLRKSGSQSSLPPRPTAGQSGGRPSAPRGTAAPLPPARGLPRRPGSGGKPEPLRPAARSNVVPIGGRLGAAPAYDEEFDAEPTRIGPLPQDMPRSEQDASAVAASPVVNFAQSSAGAYPAVSAPPAKRTSNSGMAIMFVGIGAVGAIAIFAGAKILLGTPPTQVVQTVPAPAPQTPVNTLPVNPNDVAQPVAEVEATNTEEPIEVASADPRGAARTKKSATALPTKQQNGNTPEQEEFLRRYGEGLNQQVGVNLGDQQERQGPTRQPLTDGQVRSVVTRNQPRLQRCYELAIRGMREPPTVRVNVGINVGESGAVTSVSASGGTLPALTNCIQGEVRRWRFPANEGGAQLPPFPVVFQPGG